MARTPRGAHKVVAAICSGELGGGEKEWRWRGWRAPARAEVVVVVGCVATLTLLVLLDRVLVAEDRVGKVTYHYD
nr:unnamed protein product [Digitaria exilis]